MSMFTDRMKKVAEENLPYEQRKGQELRKEDIQSHIDKIEAKKKALEQAGKDLLAEEKPDSSKYDALIEQHRFLRGKQRFFEGMLSEVGPNLRVGMAARQADFEDEKLSKDRANKKSASSTDESGAQALERLKREAEKENQ